MAADSAGRPSLADLGLKGTPEFYIAATSSLLERRPRTLKHADTFAVFDHHGDILGSESSPEGIFHEDTRYLSYFEVHVAGQRPLLLSSGIQDDNAVLIADLANPDIYSGDRLILPSDTIHIGRTKFLWEGACFERLAIRNFGPGTNVIDLGVSFAGDFRDLFEIRGEHRPRRGTVTVEVRPPDGVVLRYLGLDGVERRTELRFDPPPARIDSAAAAYRLTLAPGQRTSLFITVQCQPGPPRDARGFFVCLREANRKLRAATAKMATVDSANEVFNEVLCRAVADVYMLVTDTPDGPYPYAGIPWFSTAFGRDGIITAMQMLWIDPGIAKGVLRFLASTQAVEENPEADAAPGKILHETRKGEMARLGEVPFGLYYGSVDVTPLFVMLAGLYFQRTGDFETIATLWPNIEAALGWIDTYGDLDGDGFVEYERQTGRGLANQGWKDSHNSIFHADGSPALGPIALCEVQGYVYAAKLQAAAMARALDQSVVAATLEHQAHDLRARFEPAFWCEDLQTYALALDGDKRPCRVRTSNPGHALFAGIASAARAEGLARTLLSEDSFSGWGIRTVAAGEACYNPMSYHNGSVWPHDNALIALGLARYGLKEQAVRIFDGLFDAANYMDLRRLPELFCGFRRRRRRGPTFYPVACMPQAWASATPFALLEACLGLECDSLSNEVRFNRPVLPKFVDEITIRGLRVGDSRLDLLLRRHAADVGVNVLQRSGDIRISIIK